eukprot:CAMPEP_0172417850 /NCGR_PEP_ID=MMETSP1064-20121228/4336_1 /TAXON_ID=202472 /ORGANISM="Aulacoseira subarctica , Strain CCAP 1002/5" /LENGTH=433 /DNA_ID=CAMNT_0013156387 /DNA_START=702 /DNA_END=2007 /DNA_ORIENTATION=+
MEIRRSSFDSPIKRKSNTDSNRCDNHLQGPENNTDCPGSIASPNESDVSVLTSIETPSISTLASPLSSKEPTLVSNEKEITCTSTSSSDYQQGSKVKGSLSPFSAASSVFFKMLIPNNIAGIIIGKSGESIITLQRKCQCRIKLSQPHDFYPGTLDRVCVLQGVNYESLKLPIMLILRKYNDIGASTTTDSQVEPAHGTYRENVFIIRILIPNSASGMIIGKGGANIKTIASSASCKIQITQKEDIATIATLERLVTITGNIEACTSCICKLLDVMATQPTASQYQNLTTSYKKQLLSSKERTPSLRSAHRSERSLPISGKIVGRENSSRLSFWVQNDFYQLQPSIEMPVDTRNARLDNSFQRERKVGPIRSYRQALAPKVSQGVQLLTILIPDALTKAFCGPEGSGLNDLKLSSGASIEINDHVDSLVRQTE